jgi:hypothetical protein
MLRILKFLITGKWHICSDEILSETNVTKSIAIPGYYYTGDSDKIVIGKIRTVKCLKCGRIKSNKISL